MAAYDINENMDCCHNCIYQYYEPSGDLNLCSLRPYAVAGDYLDSCADMIKRYEPEPWTGIEMIEELMDETMADDEELMIFLGIGTCRAVEFAARDGNDQCLKRAIVMRDAVQRIFTERRNKK